ncbi:MAG: hypothetical protein P8100_08880 [bacterium]
MKTKKHTAMKALKNNAVMIILFTLMIPINLSAADSAFYFTEEEYVDDIPFDTEMICHQLCLPAMDFEEESYVDDIPFDTEAIAGESLYQAALAIEFGLTDEENVNDIPFNTSKVVAAHQLNASMEKTFELTDEAYVDDIPFSTASVVKELNGKKIEKIYASGN